jgi:antitoxin component YwqK of YwqJK toxin-antitoxin module
MKIYFLSLLLTICFFKSQSQSIVKTYYDPFTKTQLKEVYAVIPRTPTPNGLYKSYDEQGKLASIGYFSNGDKNGIWKEYSQGNLITEGAFLKGSKNGIWKEYSNGKLISSFTYNKGNKDGPFEVYREADNYGPYRLEATGSFKDDNQIKITQYYDNGKVEFIHQYTGLNDEYYESGVKKIEYPTISGNKTGIYGEWSENGMKMVEFSIINGEKNGLYTAFGDNNNIMERGTYGNGNKIGLWETFYKNGSKQSTSEINSKGDTTSFNSWYQNGKIKIQETLENQMTYKSIVFDSLSGKKITQTLIDKTPENYAQLPKISKTIGFFDPNGNSIQIVKSYSRNGKEGIWKEYLDANMNEIFDSTKAAFFRIISYRQGAITGKVMDYYINGALRDVSESNGDIPYQIDKPINNPKPNSEFLVYFPNGKINIKEGYDRWGILNSVYTYNNEGKLIKSAERKSTWNSDVIFILTWFNTNEKPFKTKEIKISIGDVYAQTGIVPGTSEGHAQVFKGNSLFFEEYNKEE